MQNPTQAKYNALKFQIVNTNGDKEVECQLIGKTFAENTDTLRAWMHGKRRLSVFIAKENDDEVMEMKGHEQHAIVYSAKTGTEVNIRLVGNNDYELTSGETPRMEYYIDNPDAWRTLEACCFSMQWTDIQYLVIELAPLFALGENSAEYRDDLNSMVSSILLEEIKFGNVCFMHWHNAHTELVTMLLRLGVNHPAYSDLADWYPELGSADYYGAAALELLKKITAAAARELAKTDSSTW